MALVTQTQYCRVDTDGRCVVAMTGDTKGIPYADCFAVEVRWVADNSNAKGQQGVTVTVGVDVDFKKSTMFKTKIKRGAVDETGKLHRNLFDEMKKESSAAKESSVAEVAPSSRGDSARHTPKHADFAGTMWSDKGLAIFLGFWTSILSAALLFAAMRSGAEIAELRKAIESLSGEMEKLTVIMRDSQGRA